MKPALQFKLSQHLAMTPQLQQSIKLLQLSTLELEQELEGFLQANPLLERIEEEYLRPNQTSPETLEQAANTEESAPEPLPSPNNDDESWLGEESLYSSATGSFDEEDGGAQDTQGATVSLREYLGAQLGLTRLSERDRYLVHCLIGALNEDGYLPQSLAELAETLPAEWAIEAEELQIALNHLQHFDPCGVGARNAPECLALQLKALPVDSTQILALKIVQQHLALLASRDFAKLKKLTTCNDAELRAAQVLIRSLNPRPGANYSPSETRYITPDVVVRKVRGQWTAHVNSDAYPRLRVNRLYAQILAKQRGSGLAGHLQEARWLIKNIQQRFDTILRVTQAIVERQRSFFDHGEIAMRPLVLREISDYLELHESTVSRVTTQKYMATPRGIFELKYFFGSHVATEAGGACSATAVRALIKQMIGAEDTKKPFSDSQLAEMLGQNGVVVARRTVAKYRESLGFSPVNLRKTV